MTSGSTERFHRNWTKKLQAAIRSDEWGQIIEAVDGYEELAHNLANQLHLTELNQAQKEVVEKINAMVQGRVLSLSSVNPMEHPTREEMEEILPLMRDLLHSRKKVIFPVDLSSFDFSPMKKELPTQQLEESNIEVTPANEVVDEKRESFRTKSETINTRAQSLLPRANKSYLCITVRKIGLKDASMYMEPFMKVSVYDDQAHEIESHEITALYDRLPPYIYFQSDVYIQLPIEEIERINGAIFFEFMHIKAHKNRKQSCRCWALLEMDEIKNGAAVLELYQKPMDPHRKEFYLFTEKRLYLHIKMNIRTI